MNKTLKFTNNPLFQSIMGDRKLMVFRHAVDGRLGMLGLSKIVVTQSGHMPKRDEAYIFYQSKKDVVKILSSDQTGQSVLEFYGKQAKEMKAELVELGLL